MTEPAETAKTAQTTETDETAAPAERSVTLQVGVVARRTKGVTRWAPWAWRAVAVLPGSERGPWEEMRRDGDAVEYHAGARPMTLHRTDTEAYLVALSNEPPVVYVILREAEDAAPDAPPELVAVTASPFEAQDHSDTGEDMVEPVPAPPALIAWISAFIERHHEDERFIKRRRDKRRVDLVEDGKGDPRVRQTADVYRAPTARPRRPS